MSTEAFYVEALRLCLQGLAVVTGRPRSFLEQKRYHFQAMQAKLAFCNWVLYN